MGHDIGLSGPLSNIDQNGASTVTFHSFADTLKWNAFSCDYGPSFVGHAMNSETYIIEHSTFGGTVTSDTLNVTGMGCFGKGVVAHLPVLQLRAVHKPLSPVPSAVS